MVEWYPIKDAPKNRFVLLWVRSKIDDYAPDHDDWYSEYMEIGAWWADVGDIQKWSNVDGLKIKGKILFWTELPNGPYD